MSLDNVGTILGTRIHLLITSRTPRAHGRAVRPDRADFCCTGSGLHVDLNPRAPSIRVAHNPGTAVREARHRHGEVNRLPLQALDFLDTALLAGGAHPQA